MKPRLLLALAVVGFVAVSAAAQEPTDTPTTKVVKSEEKEHDYRFDLFGPEARSRTQSLFLLAASGNTTPGRTNAAADATLATSSAAGTSEPEWELIWFPAYIWLPGMDGKVGAGGQTISVNVSPVDVFHKLEIGYMTALAYRRGRVGFALDLGYSKLGDDITFSGPPPPLFSSANVDSPMIILQPELSLRVVQGERGSWDMLGGFRYWHLALDIDLAPGLLPATSLHQSEDWAEPTIGSRFRLNLSPDKKWFLGVKGDIGGFGAGSRLSWQTIAGVARDINTRFFKNSTLFFGYRHISVDREHNGFIFDVNMGGFIFGIGKRFGPK